MSDLPQAATFILHRLRYRGVSPPLADHFEALHLAAFASVLAPAQTVNTVRRRPSPGQVINAGGGSGPSSGNIVIHRHATTGALHGSLHGTGPEFVVGVAVTL